MTGFDACVLAGVGLAVLQDLASLSSPGNVASAVGPAGCAAERPSPRQSQESLSVGKIQVRLRFEILLFIERTMPARNWLVYRTG
jgi:hypothetical protein